MWEVWFEQQSEEQQYLVDIIYPPSHVPYIAPCVGCGHVQLSQLISHISAH